VKKVIVLPNISIQHANAFSSHYTIGFPAMTAWLGAVHALQRLVLGEDQLSEIKFTRTGIVSHQFHMDVYRNSAMDLNSIVGMAVPLESDGNRAAFIEEARCSLKVSLILEVDGMTPIIPSPLKTILKHLLFSKIKLAGGDILRMEEPEIFDMKDETEFSRFKRFIMPGYVLVEKRSLVKNLMEKKNIDAIEAIMELVQVWNSPIDESGKEWKADKISPGWLIPIACGYQGISPFTRSAFERDEETPHRFAESIVTMGEFLMPYRLKTFDDALWAYDYDQEKSLYICSNEPIGE